MTKFATREDILGAADRKERVVKVKAWGNKAVRLMEIAYGDHASIAAQIAGKNDGTDHLFMARYVAASIVDEHGGRLFSDEDVPALAAKSRDAISQLWEAVAELNGLGVSRDAAVKN